MKIAKHYAKDKLLFPRKYLIFSYYEWYYGLRFENGIEDQPSKVGTIFIVWRKWKLFPMLSECASWDSNKVALLIACFMFIAKYKRQNRRRSDNTITKCNKEDQKVNNDIQTTTRKLLDSARRTPLRFPGIRVHRKGNQFLFPLITPVVCFYVFENTKILSRFLLNLDADIMSLNKHNFT